MGGQESLHILPPVVDSDDLAAREGNLPEETQQHEERLKDWRASQRAIDQDLEAARGEIKQLESQIPARDRAEFQRLIEKKGGLAIARAKSCGGNAVSGSNSLINTRWMVVKLCR